MANPTRGEKNNNPGNIRISSIDWDGEEVPVKATEGLVRMVRDFFR